MNREARVYLWMMAFFTFAMSMSNMFISVFIWKLNNSFTLLAVYSLVSSVVILASFPLCAAFARIRTPMASLRLGTIFFILTFALVLYYKERCVSHIYEIGLLMGLGASFFAIGMHMQSLDSTNDRGRDRFLYLSNMLNGIGGMIAPLVSGYLIERFMGMKGYYIVFSVTLLWFLLVVLMSFRLKGKHVTKESRLLEVWKHPSREWRGMYWVTMGSGFVEGTYTTFLVTMMSYTILQSELSLGGLATFASLTGIAASLVLSKFSTPERRLNIYSIGAFLVCVSSIAISLKSSFGTLAVYTVLSAIGMNLITTTLNVWTYASIEKDPAYHERRLDYIVVREIPLGFGRISGIACFLLLNFYSIPQHVLPVSFALFGSVFVLLILPLRYIWNEEISPGMLSLRHGTKNQTKDM